MDRPPKKNLVMPAPATMAPDLDSSGYLASLGIPPDPLGQPPLGPLARWQRLLDEESEKKQRELEDETNRLRRKFEEELQAIRKELFVSKEREKRIKQLEQTLAELQKNQRLGFLLNCVNDEGYRHLLNSEKFQQLFLDKAECSSLVVAIDIRRSTELMLKARNADAFASFIAKLCAELMDIIKHSYGVIDKFTGDGVISFFPEFYTGPDAAYYAVSAAQKCHEAFDRHYRANRRSFTSILTDTGLGIGIDSGTIQLVQMAGSLTVVGEPVVYACRLSGAPAGQTLLNQAAYELLMVSHGGACFVKETSIEIKHESPMLVYEVKLNDTAAAPKIPDWVKEVGSSSETVTAP